MLTKSTIKYVRSLHQKKIRKAKGRFLVEGVKPVQELLDSTFEIEDVFITDGHKEHFDHDSFFISSSKEMSQMSTMKSPPGVIAIAKTPLPIPSQKPNCPVLLLEDISDPGNLGTILRTAEWFGAPYVMLTAKTVEPFSPKVVQSAMGTLFRLPIMEVSLEEISRMEVPIYAMDMAGEPLQDHDFQPAIYVIGKESTGISQELQEITKNCITIPGAGKTESLNAAVAASVLLSQEFFNRIS